MSTRQKIKFGLFGAELICLLILLPSKALARWPHRWEKGYYQWLDRGRYIWLDRCQYQWTPCYPSYHIQQYRYPYPCPEPYRRVVIGQQPVVIEKVIVVGPRKYDEEESELLRRIKEKKSELLKKLKEGDKEERKEAVENLSGFTFGPLARAVLENTLLSDAEPSVRKEAAKSLGRVNNWKALPALKKALADSDEGVRKEAEKAIGRVKERYLKKLREAEKLFEQAKKWEALPAWKRAKLKKVRKEAEKAIKRIKIEKGGLK